MQPTTPTAGKLALRAILAVTLLFALLVQAVVTLFHLASALGVDHTALVLPDEEALSKAGKAPKRKA